LNGRLSDREGEILRLAADGATDKEICVRLRIAMPTVRTHWGRIRGKLGVLNRSHAVAILLRDGPSVRPSSPSETAIASFQQAPLAYWVWNATHQRVLVDPETRRAFGLPGDREVFTPDELLETVWTPDQDRFRRFLLQSPHARSMASFECRAGTPGHYDRLVRTVALTTQASSREGVAVLMASVCEPHACL